MKTKYDALAELAAKVPLEKWTCSGATVHIPETEEWAGKELSIAGLDKSVARAYARHIAAANPETFFGLIDDVKALAEALTEVTASLAWNAHGECRAIHDGPIMPSAQAVEFARAALARIQGEAG
jgi:hypothetical protein